MQKTGSLCPCESNFKTLCNLPRILPAVSQAI
ncbi:Uncharacterised protein [Vibrio cholerae]|nr:Uncharacterised protein [Vibrio cholerae]